MKIAFLTLGCKLNYAETSTYERGFKAAGLEAVPWNEKADIYLVNTCSVTAVSDRKSRNLVRRVHRMNPGALVVVTGCSAELRRREIEKIEGVTRVFGAEEKTLVVPETLKAAGIGSAAHSDTARSAAGIAGGGASASGGGVFAAYSTGERTRSFLKVQDGCDNFCAYCTVPYARGRSRNVPIAECVENARKIAAEGVKEIVLTGVNTGDFGRTTGESFLDLMKALNEVPGIERYRISSIEPNLLGEEIIDWIVGVISRAGSNPCPPMVIGVGIGGDFEKCAYLAKKALCRPVSQRNPKPFYAEMEAELLEKINALGIGPQGFGGTVTALGVNIEEAPTHIAGLPVSVNVGCHVTRHAEVVL